VTGAGLAALVTQFIIFNELREGNIVMAEKQKDIEKRLQVLEK